MEGEVPLGLNRVWMSSSSRVRRIAATGLFFVKLMTVFEAYHGVSFEAYHGVSFEAYHGVSFEAYHGVSGAAHQIHYNTLIGQGYRLTSLSAYGEPHDPLYAAVWVQRPGPDWEGFHGLNAADYQTKFQQLTTQGYAQSLLSAVGTTSSNAVFAGAFEKRLLVSGWMALFGLLDGDDDDNLQSFQGRNKWAAERSFTLRCASVYGNSSQRLYAAIWEADTYRTPWIARVHNTPAEYQSWFDAYTQLSYQPAFVTLSSEETYLSVFRYDDDDVGDTFYARHGLTGEELQTVMEEQRRLGLLYPISVQGGGSSSNPRYATIFAVPNVKVFTVAGTRVVAELLNVDSVMESFMRLHDVRAGQLTIAKNGVVKLERAYTYATGGYPITQPSSLMRLASVSKTFTRAAITKATDAGLVNSTTTVFPLLEITSAAISTQTPSPFIDTITVQHLLDHAGGWNSRESLFDAVFSCRPIALALGLSGPATKWDIARYMYGEPLQFQPGTQDFVSTSGASYSNFGYVLLGMVIERVSNQSYIDYLRQHVLLPLGITDVAVAGTRRDQKLPNEVFYDQPRVGLPATDPHSDMLTPFAYGGEGYLTEAVDSAGGLIASATDVATLIQSYAVWGTGGRTVAAVSGSMAGTSSYAKSRGDGVDFAYNFNTRGFPMEPVDALPKLRAKLNDLLLSTPLP